MKQKIELENETKLKITKVEYQKLNSLDTIEKIFKIEDTKKKESKEIKVQEIKQIDTYFETPKQNYFKDNSVLRVRKTNNKLIITLKKKDIKKDEKKSETKKIALNLLNNSSVEYHMEINQEKYNELIEMGRIDFSKEETTDFFPYGKVKQSAKIKTVRTRYQYYDINIDVDESTFINKYKDYEIEVEAGSLEVSFEVLMKIKNFLNSKNELIKNVENKEMKIVQNLPKIARYFMYKEKFISEFPINKIIIVEGKSDTSRLKRIFKNIITFETSGLGLTKEMVEQLKKIQQKNNLEIVVFTDPDTPGEKIRAIIQENFDKIEHAYLPKEKAISKNKKKVGIEHATRSDIINALTRLQMEDKSTSSEKVKYEMEDLINWNIYQSSEKRKLFCEILAISYGNNKKILKQINNFAIDNDKIEEVIKIINN